MREYFSKDDTLLFAKALSSQIRLDILYYIFNHKGVSLNDLSNIFKVSRSSITQHIKILIEADLIEIKHISGKKEARKICYPKEDKFIISLNNQHNLNDIYETEIPIGQYIKYHVTPTCGIATTEKLIGFVDNPRYFDDPNRMNASILWFNTGFIEYRLPNYLEDMQIPTEIQLVMEIASEAPGVAENWPSDISFYFNDIYLGYYTSNGDFGEIEHGIYTPKWWENNWNQYGYLVLLSINSRGTFVDGSKISDVTIDKLDINSNKELLFKMAVLDDAKHKGGFTLFGKNFGNYNQDIKFRVFYEKKDVNS